MKKIKVGILGCGTVGGGVYTLLTKNRSVIAGREGLDFEVVQIADVRAPKGIPAKIRSKDAYAVINNPDIEIIVETIGGVKPALDFVLAAFKAGKSVVTANKELIAKEGERLFAAAAASGVSFLFEASVGGSIPIIAALRNNLAANQIKEIYGIVNGTTNYILTKMTEEKMEFSAALKKAQELGFAEANPTADVDGYDAAYKAAILARVALGAEINFKEVSFEGISKISLSDIRYADEIGGVIKLLAVVKNSSAGIEIGVRPTIVSKKHPLASVSNEFNAIFVNSDAAGEQMYYGRGAGALPTASAIAADLIEIARSSGEPIGLPEPKIFKRLDSNESMGRYYFHLKVADKFGVLSEIAGILADQKVSIDAVLQKETSNNVATLIIITHEANEKNIAAALKQIGDLSVVKSVKNVLRVGL
jgi:homoserine dehydrogenase